MRKYLILFFLISGFLYPQEALLQKIMQARDSVSVEKLNEHIRQLENAGGHLSRVNFTPGNDSAVAYIYKELKKLPNLKVELDTFYINSASAPLNEHPLYNVVATLQGKKYPSQYYVIGAHLDCSASLMGSSTWKAQWQTIKTPGADDNATGVAALLEIARILSDSAIGMFNDYSIRFIAFGAEESGPAYKNSHHGSTHFAEKAFSRGESIPGMVSVDMIGYNPKYDYTSIVSNAPSQWLAEKFYLANKIFSVGLITNTPPFPEATYSDHNSFWLSNYSAILLIENAPPWNDSVYYKANIYYHKSYDTFSTVNSGLVKKVTQLTLCSIASLSAKFTDVADENNVPSQFRVAQNYPNPFNASTTIQYSVPGAAHVIVSVYNGLGQKVRELDNSYRDQGSYNVIFDAVNLSSGIYFYEIRIFSNDKSERFVNKMNLLK